MGKIEAQSIGRNQRALLLHMFAQDLPQRPVQQMGGGVIERDCGAAFAIDARLELVAHTDLAGLEHADVRKRGAELARVPDDEARRRAGECARVAHLAAAFGVERRMVQHHLAFLARQHPIDHGAVEYQGTDPTWTRQSIVPGEIRSSRQLNRFAEVRAELARGTRSDALRLHGRIETRLVDGKPALACDIRRQIEREAIGIVQSEHRLARNHRGFQLRGGRVQQGHAGCQGLGESALFLRENLRSTRLAAHELGVIRTHLAHQGHHQLVKERLRLAELVTMTDGAANDAP